MVDIIDHIDQFNHFSLPQVVRELVSVARTEGWHGFDYVPGTKQLRLWPGGVECNPIKRLIIASEAGSIRFELPINGLEQHEEILPGTLSLVELKVMVKDAIALIKALANPSKVVNPFAPGAW